MVWPAAGFPLLAKRNGARLVIINREPTDFDDIADLVIRDDIGNVLAPFIVHLIRRQFDKMFTGMCTGFGRAPCNFALFRRRAGVIFNRQEIR